MQFDGQDLELARQLKACMDRGMDLESLRFYPEFAKKIVAAEIRLRETCTRNLSFAENAALTLELTRRARGGPGMICVGYATVDELSGNTQNIGAHDDRFIPGLARLAGAFRDNGSLSAVQLNHAGRYNFSFFLDGKQPVAPSAIASRMTKETPKALETDEIKAIVTAFAAAAARVKQAGKTRSFTASPVLRAALTTCSNSNRWSVCAIPWQATNTGPLPGKRPHPDGSWWSAAAPAA